MQSQSIEQTISVSGRSDSGADGAGHAEVLGMAHDSIVGPLAEQPLQRLVGIVAALVINEQELQAVLASQLVLDAAAECLPGTAESALRCNRG